MSEAQLNGDPASVAVDRGGSEFRGGRAVDLVGDAQRWRLACVETLDSAMLSRLQGAEGPLPTLYLTAHRARAVGLEYRAVAMTPTTPWTLTGLRALSGLSREPIPDLQALSPVAAPEDLNAGFALAKRTRLLPALLGGPVDAPEPQMLEVRVADVEANSAQHGVNVVKVSEARVPLADHEDVRFVLFRDAAAGIEHLALVLGDIDGIDPVPVRLHSSCLTGDLLGSLRCDCGEQLRTAVRCIASAGGGVLLYLSQEGRGIGLANKLRAYGLQDDGLDTIEADHHLGFLADERDFQCAASMLEALGVARIELYTNNPRKLDAMRSAGVDVVQRRPLVATINAHNARYVRTKRERAGHL